MRQRRQGGFTLIETVISLVLLSFIAMIGYQGLIFGMEQWQKGHDRLEFRQAYQQAIGWMRTSVGTAEKVIDRRVSPRHYRFDGGPHSVEFVTRFERARRAGLYVTRLFHDPADNSLKVSYYLYHPEIDPRKAGLEPDSVTILEDVASMRVSYYGKNNSKAARWQDSWENAFRLPRLLRIEIDTVDGITHRSIINVLTSNDA
jgi:prepilin-type N-terminal cleavage/methylation domain-containing protein